MENPIKNITVASLQDLGFLNLKDSQFVEDVSFDIKDFQEARDSYRVLVFPPLASYHRLLVHKVVESHFPDLVTFSVGEQVLRRTVVAFVEACHRGEKGIQLLSQPKESRAAKPSNNSSSSKWRNLSSQERVANWVKLREIKNKKREIWNSPKLFNVSDLEQRDDIEMSAENFSGIEEMDRSKQKKHAAAVYVPPFLRARRGEEDPDKNEKLKDYTESEKMNNSQENENMSNSQGNESMSNSHGNENMCNSQGNENRNNSQSSYSESVSLSPGEQNSPGSIVSSGVGEEPQRPRGRGRGRRKPEIQVYVPKALRESKKETDKEEVAGSCSGQQELSGPVLDHSTESIDRVQDRNDIFDDCEEGEIKQENVLDKCDRVTTVIPPHEYSITHKQNENVAGDNVQTQQSPPVPMESVSGNNDTDGNGALSIDCSQVPDGQVVHDSALTFEFYDPAVIAFMPSPKLPQEVDPNISNINFGNPFPPPMDQINQPQLPSNDLASCEVVEEKVQNDQHGSNKGEKHVTSERMDQTNVTCDVVSSEDTKQDPVVNILCDETNLDNPKVSTEKASKEATSTGKKKNKSDEKVKKKKKREEKTDSITGDQTSAKKTKSKSKNKSAKTLPEEEVKAKSSGEKQPSSKRPSAERQSQEEDNDDDDDTWDAMFDDDGDCLEGSVLDEITAHVGKVEIDRPKIDYLSYTPKEPNVNYEVFSHIVEIYDFPPEFGPHDIVGAFKDFISQGFDLKWIDDTHALGVFSSSLAAREALKVFHPMLKTRPMSEASRQGLNKAKSCQEFLQPYKERPQTTSMAARRLVAGALGVAPKMSKEMREQERNKLKAAKEKRRQEKQQKVDIWDGNFGKCAMDDL